MSSPKIDQPFYKPSDVATMLSVHRTTVYRWIANGTLRSMQFGDNVRIPGPSLLKFIESGAGEPVPEIELNSDVADIEAQFTDEVGHSWEEFVDLWRESKIERTPANEAILMRALGVRAIRSTQLQPH